MVQSERCPVSQRPKSSSAKEWIKQEEYFPTYEEAKRLGCFDNWAWSENHKSSEVRFYGEDRRVVHFHPNWSSGTAGVRGDVALDCRRYFWELHVSQRVFGTSIMFGVATKKARMHADTFTNMIGEDEHGWGLSHKGLLWHGGQWSRYTTPFPENQATVIGLLYDGAAGTLTYFKASVLGEKGSAQWKYHAVARSKYLMGDLSMPSCDKVISTPHQTILTQKDGVNLGVAFRGLHHSKVYPMVCSTAAKTKMTLEHTRRDLTNLQDRCRAVIAQYIVNRARLSQLPLPPSLTEYVAQSLPRTRRVFLPACQRNCAVDM